MTGRPSITYVVLRACLPLLVMSCGDSSAPAAGNGTPTPAAVASITVGPALDSLLPGDSVALTATVKDGAGNALTGRTVTWASADTTKASVSASGVARARVSGQTFVRATSEGHSDSATIVVRPVPVASLVLNPPSDTLGSNDSLQFAAALRDASGAPLSNRVVTWSTTSAAVSISSSGLLKAQGVTGTISVIATSEGKSDTSFVELMSCFGPAFVTANRFTAVVQAGGFWGPGPLDNAVYLRTTGTTLTSNPTQVMYAGGVVYGTSAGDVVHAWDFFSGTSASDVTPGAVCPLSAPAGTNRTYSDVRPLAGRGPVGLEVRQESLAFSGAAADTGYVLLRYTFTNTGAAAISGFYSGFGADWDLYWASGATTDVVRWNSAIQVAEAVKQDSVTYKQIVAAVPVASAGTASAAGWLYSFDPNRAGYFTALSGGVTLTSVGPGDVRAVSGVGPVSIAAGAKFVMYVAIVGGDSRAQFNTNVATARAKAAALGF